MVVKTEIIKENLQILENAMSIFTILREYYNLQINRPENPSDTEIERERSLKAEASAFKINQYINFIDFIVNSEKNGQKVFYDKKIKNVELQRILEKNAHDEYAKKTLRNKNKTTFATLITSKKWDTLCGYQKKNFYKNNLNASSPIIANYCIQNEIELDHNAYYYRINSYYTQKLEQPDTSILTEMNRTKFITDYIIEKLSENGLDFRKANLNNLVETITEEFKRRMLRIEPGEQIKCIENPQELKGLTIGKNYRVISKFIEFGVLKVSIDDDSNNTFYKYPFRFFESVSSLRLSVLSDFLGD